MPRLLLHHILIFWMLALQLSKTTRLLHPFQILMNLASNIYIISEIAFSLGVPFVPFSRLSFDFEFDSDYFVLV